MSRIQNHIFSRDRGREVSYLEAKVDSIKRQSKSAVSRYRDRVSNAMASESAVSPTFSILW